MPFTTETIRAVFSLEPGASEPQQAFLDHPNFALITDYLTGKSASLNGLVPVYENHVALFLAQLVSNPEEPNPDEQRVLDVLFHPALLRWTEYPLNQWLGFRLVMQTERPKMDALYRLMRKTGGGSDETFLMLLDVLGHADEVTVASFHEPDSTLRRFLEDHLPAQLVLSPNTWQLHVAPHSWNRFYFLLLETEQPHYVHDYLISGLAANSIDIPWLLHHSGGKYLPQIQAWLRQPTRVHTELTGRLACAAALLAADAARHGALVADVARNYLLASAEGDHRYFWEGGLHLDEFRDTDYSYLGFSGVAMHLLATVDPAGAKEALTEAFGNKRFVPMDVLRVLRHHFSPDVVLPYLGLALKADGGIDYYRRIVNLLETQYTPAEFLPLYWERTGARSKPLRELVAKQLARHDPDADSKAIALLDARSADTRQTAALILSHCNSPKAAEAIRAMLDREPNDATRDILLGIAKDLLPPFSDRSYAARLVTGAAARGKLAKPVVPWLREEELPPLYDHTGVPLSGAEIRFLFYRMHRVRNMRSDPEARYLLEHVDRKRATPFARKLLHLFEERETKAEDKFLLLLAALLGDDEVAGQIRRITDGWIGASRWKMAEYGVGALALQGGNRALRWVEGYSRQYRNRKANIGAAALQALNDAAEELGISVHELADRVVPDLGFGGLYKEFEVGGEPHRAFIDSRFKLCYFTEEGRKLKSLPAGTAAELKEEFKAIGKEVRDVVRSQSGRLEYYLLIQRRWKAGPWQEFFLQNPVMFIYATRLLWGRYDAHGRLLRCFRCTEDLSIIDRHDEELELAPEEEVGIVHPLQLAPDERTAWSRQFYDASIEPIFPQLDRTVHFATEEEKALRILTRFQGREVESGTLLPVLEKKGWRKGAALDGGYVDHCSLTDAATGVRAILELEDVFVAGYLGTERPRIGRLYFLQASGEKERWLRPPANDTDARLVAVKDLPPIFYSEVWNSILALRLKETESIVAGAEA